MKHPVDTRTPEIKLDVLDIHRAVFSHNTGRQVIIVLRHKDNFEVNLRK
jgi:hypothetical protein